jgi:hypothetical protein
VVVLVNTYMARMNVYVDGQEVRRWISGLEWDDADTGVWVNLDFAPGRQAVLSGFNDAAGVAVGSSSSIDNLVMSTSVLLWPSSGRVRIDDELFTWDGIDTTTNRLLNITRAVGGTSAAAHAIGATAYWVQHDIQIVYGDGVAAATSFPDDTYANGAIRGYDDRKPMITMGLSSNTSWLWGDFGEDIGTGLEQKPRAARWKVSIRTRPR